MAGMAGLVRGVGRIVQRYRQPIFPSADVVGAGWDYIVVGAGSAGCAVAARLSENPSKRVLLLEAGGPDTYPWIHVPVGYFKTMHNSKYDWCYTTDRKGTGLGDRSLTWPRGKVLGGSSSLNGMLYVRGQPDDYNAWGAVNPGWSWDDVRPVFTSLERHSPSLLAQTTPAISHPGKSGPVHVSATRYHSVLCDRFIRAGVELGLQERAGADINADEQEGIGYFVHTTADGIRCSSASAYLNNTRGRENLSVVTHALVQRLVLDKRVPGDGVGVSRQTKGVEFTDERTGAARTGMLNAGGEVVLCAGAIGSPQILAISGLTSAETAHKIGVQHTVDLPGVGRNLQDHLQLRQVFTTDVATLNTQLNTAPKRILAGMQYAFTRTGPLSMAASTVAAFVKSGPEAKTPDVQFHLQPLSASTPGAGLDSFSGFTSSVCQLRPSSRGHLDFISADPRVAPIICPNYLATDEDKRVAVQAIRYSRRLCMGTQALGHIVNQEMRPGSSVTSDEDILQSLAPIAESIYHPVGTCKMGPAADKSAVVDHELCVHNVNGLRVADASIMPTIVSANTNAATMMIGEKCAQMILQRSSKAQ